MSTLVYPDYSEFEKIVCKAIVRVHALIGGDLEDMLSYAGDLFIKAVRTFKKGRGRQLKTHCYKVAWDDTFARRRIELGRLAKFDMDADLMMVKQTGSSFSLPELLGELSDDARRLVELTLEPPETVRFTDGGLPKKNSLFATAKKMLGWSAEQLEETIAEIHHCLCGA